MGAVADEPGRLAVTGALAPLAERSQARGPRRALLLLAGLTALAAALRFWRIAHQGFWFDEGNTALLVHRSFGRMLGLIPQSESTPPLYYATAWVWARIFGFGEAGLRSLSALAGVATVPLAYVAGGRLLAKPGESFSRRAGLIAAALAACSPLLIWYSQEARSYSLLVMLGAAALAAFAEARERPSAGALAAWALACALALATHYYAVLMIVPQALLLAARHRRDRRVQSAVGVVFLCGMALIPLALSQNSTGHDSWIGHTSLGLRLRQVIPQLLVGPSLPAREPLKLAAIAIALAALAPLALRANAESRRRAAPAAGLVICGVALALVFVLAGSDSLITRNIIGLWLPAAMVLAAGLAAARTPGAGQALTAALCAIGIGAAAGVALSTDLQRPDWRQVARVLGPRAPAGTRRVVLIQHYRTLLPLSLYLPHLEFLRARRAGQVSEIDVIGMQSPGQELCWWGAWCNLVSSGMQRDYAIAGFHEVWRRRVQHFTIVRLVADHPETVAAASLARALRTTRLGRDDLLVQR